MGSQQGFSLIEMLVALAVLAISGLALMNATHQSTRAAQILEGRSMIALASENILNAQLIEQSGHRPVSSSGEYEMSGRGYEWSLTAVPTADPGLVRLELNVVQSGGEAAHRIVTFRGAP